MKRNCVGLATVLVVVLAGLWGDSPAAALLAQCSANYGVGIGSTVTLSFPVGKGNQTITFTSTAPAGATVGGPTYTVTATASSGLTVTFTIDAAATSVCSISGSTVSFTGVGTCVIDANQAGNANYNAAPQVQQSFAVGMGG
jgi:hypothetical protein